MEPRMTEELIIGLVSISDRASAGVYKDEGIPSLKEWLTSAIASPKWRDETRLIADEQPAIERTLKELAGFGEQMRALSLKFVPTAILSRQVAVIRKGALIINLPGQPKSIRETLQGLPDVPEIFAAVPYCIDLIDGPYIETNEAMVRAFRPKSAVRKA